MGGERGGEEGGVGSLPTPRQCHIVRVGVKAGDAFTRTRLMATFGLSAERPAEGPEVRVQGSGFRVQGSGFRRRSPCRHAVRGFHLFAFALGLLMHIFPPTRAPRT